MSFNSTQFASFTRSFNFDDISNDNQLRKIYTNLKPWREFCDITRINKPQSLTEVTRRLTHNSTYFVSNYTCVFGVLFLYCLFTNWVLLWLLVFTSSSLYLISKLNNHDLNLSLLGHELTISNSSLFASVVILTLIALFFASPFATVIWLATVGGCICFVHGILLDKPAETAFNDIV